MTLDSNRIRKGFTIAPLNELIALGSLHIVGLKKDGTVVATGKNQMVGAISPTGRISLQLLRESVIAQSVTLFKKNQLKTQPCDHSKQLTYSDV